MKKKIMKNKINHDLSEIKIRKNQIKKLKDILNDYENYYYDDNNFHENNDDLYFKLNYNFEDNLKNEIRISEIIIEREKKDE